MIRFLRINTDDTQSVDEGKPTDESRGLGPEFPKRFYRARGCRIKTCCPTKFNSTKFWGTICSLIENAFGERKLLFRIIRDKSRGPRSLLKLIIPIPISLTNYHVKSIP
jgi:hypothetical protein